MWQICILFNRIFLIFYLFILFVFFFFIFLLFLFFSEYELGRFSCIIDFIYIRISKRIFYVSHTIYNWISKNITLSSRPPPVSEFFLCIFPIYADGWDMICVDRYIYHFFIWKLFCQRHFMCNIDIYLR